MRLAPSFVFSLLMLLTLVWGQAAASASSDALEGDAWMSAHPLVSMEDAFLDELEQEDDTEFAELTAHGGNSRQQLTLPACEDRFELYWPPMPMVVQAVHVWAPPLSRVSAHVSPAPGQLLRPPSFSLLG